MERWVSLLSRHQLARRTIKIYGISETQQQNTLAQLTGDLVLEKLPKLELLKIWRLSSEKKRETRTKAEAMGRQIVRFHQALSRATSP